jgi:membrane protein
LRRIRAVIFDAVTHFNNDDGWAMASHVALSILMALFPFMIFGTSLASFLGAHAYADTASHLIFRHLARIDCRADLARGGQCADR